MAPLGYRSRFQDELARKTRASSGLRQVEIDLPLAVQKEQVAFFRAGDPEAFRPGRLPLVIHRFPKTTSLGSVFPIFDHAGIKVMIDRTGPEVAPDDADRFLTSLTRPDTSAATGTTSART